MFGEVLRCWEVGSRRRFAAVVISVRESHRHMGRVRMREAAASYLTATYLRARKKEQFAEEGYASRWGTGEDVGAKNVISTAKRHNYAVQKSLWAKIERDAQEVQGISKRHRGKPAAALLLYKYRLSGQYSDVCQI
nr:hypothetical protein CFP56_48711 [Quercus suber]